MDLKMDSKFPLIMGILNCTPDSFYSKSCLHGANDILQQASKMLSEGATILDIGGCSTRPNATFPTEEEEWKRLSSSLEILRKTFPNIPISVDTFRTEIAKRSIEEFEVEMINDISGGEEEGMFPLILQKGVSYVLTYNDKEHIPNTEEIVKDAKEWFQQKLPYLSSLEKEKLILDLGFGFSKTLEENYKLLSHLEEFKSFGYPLLVGISRKSMIYKFLNCSVEDSLNGTSILHFFSLLKGADILRVHDVKPTYEGIQMYRKLRE